MSDKNINVEDQVELTRFSFVSTQYRVASNEERELRHQVMNFDPMIFIRNRKKVEFTHWYRITYDATLAKAVEEYDRRLDEYLKDNKAVLPCALQFVYKNGDPGSYCVVRTKEVLDVMLEGKDSKDQGFWQVIEEGIALNMAPTGMNWCIFDNDHQCMINDGYDCFEEANNVLPMLSGGDYSIFCIPMGMKVVKTTHYKEGVSEISYTVQDKKEE